MRKALLVTVVLIGACASACGVSRSTVPTAVASTAVATPTRTAPPASAPAARPAARRSVVLAAAPVTRTAPRPRIVARPIPFGARRRAEMVAYTRRHYGSFMAPTFRLRHPQVIVEHFTQTATFAQAYDTFATDQPDSELHELPATCAHFVIDTDGTIYQLVPLGIECRHTVGLNWTAIGIEHVGFSDQQVLGNRRQMRSSLALTCWLRTRLHIKPRNVIGHNESLSSPFHREDVARLRSQTHSDMAHAAMQIYRARLAATCATG